MRITLANADEGIKSEIEGISHFSVSSRHSVDIVEITFREVEDSDNYVWNHGKNRIITDIYGNWLMNGSRYTEFSLNPMV
jgi:hypothetical protein